MTESKVETLSLIEGLVKEQRTFPPSDEFRRSAIISDDSVYREADRDFEGFWSRLAHEFLTWFEAPTQGLEWRPPHCTWFADGILNASVNCLDRHVAAGRGERVAYHWEGETPGEARTVTYADLLREVCWLANGLKALGVRRGDRVGIYMGMVPELPTAMLACARIGAPHIVVFGGFSAESLAERLRDSGAKLLITQDQGWRKGGKVPLKVNADQACTQAPNVERVVVLRRTGDPVPREEHDVWWHELVHDRPETCVPERMGAEDTLFLLHTSGSTAKPKGALHTTAGYLLHASVTHKWIFDIHDDTVWWCAADIGWVPGTRTSSTGRSRTGRRASSTKATPPTRTGTATGTSSSATASTPTTRRRR
jgi:acetyl-CoA synthetase